MPYSSHLSLQQSLLPLHRISLPIMGIIKDYRRQIHQLMLATMVILALPATAQNVMHKVDVQDWLKTRHRDSLTSHPSLRAVMADWTSTAPGSHIEIYFADDKSHAEWAIELRNRLVALGIPSQYLKLQMDDMDDTFFGLRVVTPGAARQ